MSNSFTFLGRLGRDAELKDVGSSQVLNFSIATDTGFGDRKVTSWYTCAVWGKQAVALEQYLTKGKRVVISGELTMRPYTDKNDQKRLSADIRVNYVDFADSKGEDQGPEPDMRHTDDAPKVKQAEPANDDDLPF